jgi:hypothetical protein
MMIHRGTLLLLMLPVVRRCSEESSSTGSRLPLTG